MEEDVDEGRVPEVVAHNGERPDKGPAIGMQLGGSHVDLSQQGPFEASERETQLNPFEDGLVEEKVGSPSLVRSSEHTGSPFAQGQTET